MPSRGWLKSGEGVTRCSTSHEAQKSVGNHFPQLFAGGNLSFSGSLHPQSESSTLYTRVISEYAVFFPPEDLTLLTPKEQLTLHYYKAIGDLVYLGEFLNVIVSEQLFTLVLCHIQDVPLIRGPSFFFTPCIN